jgi:hypothetical protein
VTESEEKGKRGGKGKEKYTNISKLYLNSPLKQHKSH